METQVETDVHNKQKCSDCAITKANPQLGHNKCKTHRPCTGDLLWNPEECDICILQRNNISTWTSERRKQPIKQFFDMLQETASALSTAERTWTFEETLESFFSIQNTEAPEGEHSRIPDNNVSDNTPIAKQSDLATGDPTTNNLLLQMMGSIKELSGILSNMGKETTQKIGQNKPVKRRRRTPSPQADDDDSEESDNDYQRSRKKKRKTINSRKNERRSRKRVRSPSQSSQDSSDSNESDDTTDTDRVSVVSKSSASVSRPRKKRKGGEDYFNDGSTIYFYTRDHRVIGNKVWFNDELRDVKWHKTKNAFTLMNTVSNNEMPYMSATQAHEALVSCFNVVQDPSEKPGLDRRSYRVHFDDNSELAKAIRLIQESAPEALHSLFTGGSAETEKFWKTFSKPTLKTPSMVNFSSGWNFSGKSYLTWAKNDKLNPLEFSGRLDLNFVPFIPPFYLEEETRTRSILVDSISGLSMLDSLAKELKENLILHTAVEAISRHYLPQLCDNSLRWMFAKMDVRKIVLQGSQNPQAIALLKSNMWEPTIFESEMIERFVKSGLTTTLSAGARLGIYKSTSDHYKRSPHTVDPSKMGPKVKNNQKKDQSFLDYNRHKHQDLRTFLEATQNNANKYQNNYNPKGSGSQYKGISGKNQKLNNKSKGWSKGNKGKNNRKSHPGAAGGHKGNKNSQ